MAEKPPSTWPWAPVYAYYNTLQANLHTPGTMTVPRTTTKGQKVGSGPISKNPHPFPNPILSPKLVFLNGYAGDVGGVSSIPGSGRNPGKGNGNPLQYVCRENPMDKGAWWL